MGRARIVRPAGLSKEELVEWMQRVATPQPKPVGRRYEGLVGSCLISHYPQNEKGYAYTRHKGKLVGVHRITWEVENDEPVPEGMEICHGCHIPNCIRGTHLRADTHQGNVDDIVGSGARLKHPSEYMTAEKVRRIRELYATTNYTQKRLAEMYGVTTDTISKIVNRRTWAHVA